MYEMSYLLFFVRGMVNCLNTDLSYVSNKVLICSLQRMKLTNHDELLVKICDSFEKKLHGIVCLNSECE